LDGNPGALFGKGPQQSRDALRKFVDIEIQAGRLSLTRVPTRLAWQLWDLLHGAWVLLILTVLAPLLLLYLPVFLLQLRRRESCDPEITRRHEAQYVTRLAELEDQDATNQFSAIGTLKPGRFRRWCATFFLWILNNASRHIYSRGYLTRVSTI